MGKNKQVALVGNPNSGKSSLFNALTGLNQKVGNFPGVTVEKRIGNYSLDEDTQITIVDLPGTYSLYPKRNDEWVSYKVLLQQDEDILPDAVILVADASNLKRNLLFCSQIIDLKIPVLVVLTMTDLARKHGIQIDINGLETELGVPVISLNPRTGKGIQGCKKVLLQVLNQTAVWNPRPFIDWSENTMKAIQDVENILPGISGYKAIHYLIHHEKFSLDANVHNAIEAIELKYSFNHTKTQAEEILSRYQRIRQLMSKTVAVKGPLEKKMQTERIDDVLLHPIWGYLFLFTVLFVLFQSIFLLAQFPMKGIEWVFTQLSVWFQATLPNGWATSLFIDGILSGIGGVLVFVPQIMILFGLITLLEDTGYMARISFLTDRFMRKSGLNGKSVMPLISGFACAVPAIMSARNIENQKERLLTILITPFMSCSARLPVFTILIALIIPPKFFLGAISLQGLVMMLLYLSGVIIALIVSWVAKWFITIKEKSYFILELPIYRTPRWANALSTMVEKAKVFVFDAGKIIMMISIGLWFLSSYGPKEKIAELNAKYKIVNTMDHLSDSQRALYASEKLSESYAGQMGRMFEPIIQPLGFDWKIGIALITSFAAREVFVGTMATLYSVGENQTEKTLTQKMGDAKRADGSKVYTLATGLSLLTFYLLALQCMSTIAIVRRETNSWIWPIIQFIVMTGLAYIFSFAVYQLLQ